MAMRAAILPSRQLETAGACPGSVEGAAIGGIRTTDPFSEGYKGLQEKSSTKPLCRELSRVQAGIQSTMTGVDCIAGLRPKSEANASKGSPFVAIAIPESQSLWH